MSHENKNPQARNSDPSLKEVSLNSEIKLLRNNPAISAEDLFSSNKMKSSEYPDKPGVRVELGTPIESAISSRSDVVQDLMAVVSLGEDVAIGVVKGTAMSGNEVNYLSILNNNPTENEGRASFINVLSEGSPVTVGRHLLEQVVGHEGATPAVSGTHCTIELNDGVLTVVDETSTNGTSVLRNTTDQRTSQFRSIRTWAQPSAETGELIAAEQEAKRLSRVSQLGRFTVDNG